MSGQFAGAQETAMTFRLTGIEQSQYAPLFGLETEALAALGVERHLVSTLHASPCRITLDDAAPGETVLLLNHPHQTANSPYAQSGPIFLREAAEVRFDRIDEIAPALARRVISLRGFDDAGAMVEGELTDGADLAALIERFWANPRVAYAHAHYARRGCFAALVSRV
jgi:hypothetical protein